MNDDRPQKSTLAKFAGLAVGIMIGGIFGPIVFAPGGRNIPLAEAAGSFFGAVLGYASVAVFLLLQGWRRDYELQLAAEAVKLEAGLPSAITIKVKDARITLGGKVEDYAERHKAEQVVSTLPAIKAVINNIRLRPGAEQVIMPPAEIQRQIQDRLVRLAEQDGKGIRVTLNDSRLVLEGKVHSSTEASDAEEVAWTIPGIAEVENRLEIAA